MIRRRAPLRRSGWHREGGRSLNRSAKKQILGSRMIDSKGERSWAEWLMAEQADGRVRGLRFQVTHGLRMCGGHACCKCFGPHVCNPSARTTYSPRLDFQFEEPDGRGGWRLVYADAKAWLDPDGKQFLGYRDFAAIHGCTVRLYLPRGVVREFS